jgi:Family of unknown function (DUF6786)
MRQMLCVLLPCVLAGACGPHESVPPPASTAASLVPGTFGDDLAFLRAHTRTVVLADADGAAQVIVAPDYQGRVMTSTDAGASGQSFGYVHRPGISAGQRQPHMTVLGGEDRFWLGPEGGQFGLYFPPGAAFDTEHWQVPAPIDWGPWTVVEQTDRSVVFRQPMEVTNYSGTRFDIRVDRTVRLLDRAAVAAAFGYAPAESLHLVAYESENHVTNTGSTPWTKATGLVSIWILGQYRPAPHTTVVLPIVAGPRSERGPTVNDAYFGAIPAGRLHQTAATVFFRGDGRERGKIGIPRRRARDVAGSYDPDSHVLTLVRYSLPESARDYVNSMWEQQRAPFGGDVVNSYNDGPLGPGQLPLGPFYEIESSSPAAALRPGESLEHVHRTVHLTGPDADLDAVARAVLGVSLDGITSSLPADPSH